MRVLPLRRCRSMDAMGPKVASCTLEELVEELSPGPPTQASGSANAAAAAGGRSKKAE